MGIGPRRALGLARWITATEGHGTHDGKHHTERDENIHRGFPGLGRTATRSSIQQHAKDNSSLFVIAMRTEPSIKVDKKKKRETTALFVGSLLHTRSTLTCSIR